MFQMRPCSNTHYGKLWFQQYVYETYCCDLIFHINVLYGDWRVVVKSTCFILQLPAVYLNIRDDAQKAEDNQHVDETNHLPQRYYIMRGWVPVVKHTHTDTHTEKLNMRCGCSFNNAYTFYISIFTFLKGSCCDTTFVCS